MRPRELLAVLACLAGCGAAPTHSKKPEAHTLGDQRTDALSSVASPRAASCPSTSRGRAGGRLHNPRLNEASGLVASLSQPGLLWTHNDSGDRARLFGIDATGRELADVFIAGATAKDWEDIALMPVQDGPDTLLIGDIGDNWAVRDSVQIYFVPEPRLSPSETSTSLKVSARRLEVRYADGPRDAEALLHDPLTGDLYIVAKAPFFQLSSVVGVYRISAAAASSKEATAERVAEVPLGPVTAGDVSPDGLSVALRNYHAAYLYRRVAGEPLFRAFAGEGCELSLADLNEQGEALCFAHDGRSYFTVAEGIHPALYQYDLGAR